MESYGASYRYQPAQSSWLDNAEFTYTHNETLGLADTWQYGLGWERANADNPKLEWREYRPTKTDTDQFNFDVKALPIEFGGFGEHAFFSHLKYAKQDYTTTAHYLSYEDGVYNDDDSFVNYAFPDAKKTNYSITLGDNIHFNDRLNVTLGMRYDNYKYSPYYQSDAVGTSKNNSTEEKNAYGTCVSNQAQTIFCQAYRDGTHHKKSKFDNITWTGSVDYDVIPDKLTARYKIGTGFLAPTVTQVYSNFVINDAEQVPNYNLKPEKSLNHELEFEYKTDQNITLTAGAYHSKYKDFIHTKYWNGDRRNPVSGCISYTCLQSINADDAEITGLKFGVHADLSHAFQSKGKFNVFANLHTAKDKAFVITDAGERLKINTLAAVPTSLILGGTYTAPNDDWQINVRGNIIKRKKSDDVKYLNTLPKYAVKKVYCNDTYYAGYCDWAGFYDYDDTAKDYYKTERTFDGYTEFVDTYDVVKRSKNVMIWDIYGSKKFGKNSNFIVNAGIYNITDEKYIPWETLRQFATTSANHMVDKEGYGFNRYTAPGRNYAVSLTYEF